MNRNLKQTGVFAVFVVALIVWYYSQDLNIWTNTNRSLRVSITTSNRIALVDQTCSGISRSDLNSTGYKSSHIDTVNSSIGVDGVAFLRLAIASNYKQAANILRQNPQGYLIFIISFLAGFAILLVVSPFLLCCCLCPGCCPSRCCRKPEQVDFTNCQIKYPIVFVSVGLIAALICSVYLLAANTGNSDSLQRSMCAASVIYDDALNGNVSSSGNYFVGINSLPSLLAQLSGNLTYIDTNLAELYSTSSTSALNQAITQTQTTETDIKKIPNNDGTAGSKLTLVYNTPIDSATTTSTISSNFPNVLGSYATQSGYVWNLYRSANTFEKLLSYLKSNATSIHNKVNTIQSSLNTSSNQANTFLASIQYQNDGSFASAVRAGSNAGSGIKIGTIVYLVVVIVIAITATIAAICLCNQKSRHLRCLLYFACFIIFLLTFVGFLFAILLSFLLPVHAWSCNFIQESLSSQVGLQTSFITVTSASNLRYIGRCMPFGDGDLMNELGGSQISSDISSINSVMSVVSNFKSSTYLNPIKTGTTTLMTLISNYGLNKIGDLSDSTTISKIKDLSSCSSQTNCNSACTADSWVPSNSFVSNTQGYSCKVSSPNQGNAGTCSSGVSSTSGGCSGCMDSGQVLFRYLNPTYTLLTDLSTRYGASCSFNAKLNNVWNNYYKIKQTAIGPTVGGSTSSSGVYPRATTVNNDLTTLTTKVDALNITFSNIMAGLDNVYHLIDPVTGLTASLNCKVLGEDTQNLQDQACGPLYDYLYLSRLVIGIISYLLAISLCCVVCVTSRNFRRHQHLDEIYQPRVEQKNENRNGLESDHVLGVNTWPLYYTQDPKL